jgi:hypothetical protein
VKVAHEGGNDAVSDLLSPESMRGQIERILHSSIFRNCQNLQHFLQYITSMTLDGRAEEINEYALATEVFGRGKDFDSSADTIVRTQAYRLRLKLREYYQSEGSGDRVIVEIPKGRYVPVFSLRPAIAPEPLPHAVEEIRPAGVALPAAPLFVGRLNEHYSSPAPPSFVRAHAFTLAVFVAALAMLIGVFTGWHLAYKSISAKSQPLDPAQSFWTDFLDDDREPILAFSNGVYLITRYGDLLRFRGTTSGERGSPVYPEQVVTDLTNREIMGKTGPLRFDDSVTGTGDLEAASRISVFLSRMGLPVKTKRSRLVTIDDLRNHNVIFIGSSFDNLILRDIVSAKERFAFDYTPEQRNPMLWANQIRDLEPVQGATGTYGVECDPKSSVMRADHAVISILPGVVPNRKVMILAGLTSTGTDGAGHFICSPNNLMEAASRLNLHAGRNGLPPFFQCVLRIEANRGVDVMRVQLVAAKTLRKDQ